MPLVLLKTPCTIGAVEDTMCGREGTISAGPIGGTDIRSGGTLHSLPASTWCKWWPLYVLKADCFQDLVGYCVA